MQKPKRTKVIWKAYSFQILITSNMKENWRVGDLCVTKASDSLGGEWANAEIKEIDENRNTAKVEYIEFGDGEDVALENLKKFGTHVVGRDGELVIDGAVRFSFFLNSDLQTYHCFSHKNRQYVFAALLRVQLYLF